MRITLILTGKTKERYLEEGIEEYVKRLKSYVPFRIEVLPDTKHSRKMDVLLVKKIEGEKIMQKLRKQDHVILLDERGKAFSSMDFAFHLADMERRTGNVVFVIGGAYGFSKEVYERANEKFSMSKMTFSHQMVRLIFTEQIYRAYTILRGEPYHHK